jgi:hypothetical protein
MNVMTLEGTLTLNFLTSTMSNNNMADAQMCEVAVTPVPFNIGSWNDE